MLRASRAVAESRIAETSDGLRVTVVTVIIESNRDDKTAVSTTTTTPACNFLRQHELRSRKAGTKYTHMKSIIKKERKEQAKRVMKNKNRVCRPGYLTTLFQ
jgi:hypothetical protein